MTTNKSYSIHSSKKSLVDRDLKASKKLMARIKAADGRLIKVGSRSGVVFVNDAAAVDLLSTRDTFKCMDGPIVWIAAAPPHERDYALIKKYVQAKVKSIVIYGGKADYMRRHLGSSVAEFRESPSLQQAVEVAFALAESGDTIVYSPARNPDDEFRNYVDRADHFKGFVSELKTR